MRQTSYKKWLIMALAVLAVGALVYSRLGGPQGGGKKRASGPAPVEVAAIEHGALEERRAFSGALEATAEFVVAPKVAGRVKSLAVDLADTVRRGQVVATLDDDEYVQAVAQARADLAVAQANLAQASSAAEIAEREFARVRTLRKRGVASDAQLDEAKANQLAKQGNLAVARAQLTRAQAALEAANIRLGYTRVAADWAGGGDARVVAQRFVDEGETVAANAPLLSIVELQPITGVIHVAERDYARLRPGQAVSLTTDAYPGERFAGRISRIAPVFQKTTRQARVELVVDNPDQRLRPGMFIQAQVVLARRAEAVIVPEEALVERGQSTGVFVVGPAGRTALWREVRVGIRQGGRVQITGQGLEGRVITLGQQLVSDGGAVTIPDDQAQPAAGAAKQP